MPITNCSHPAATRREGVVKVMLDNLSVSSSSSSISNAITREVSHITPPPLHASSSTQARARQEEKMYARKVQKLPTILSRQKIAGKNNGKKRYAIIITELDFFTIIIFTATQQLSHSSTTT